jgi:hypothetical protein
MTPRDRLRARHDQQLALLNSFLGFDAKVARARSTLASLETEQRAVLGELAAVTSVDIAADLTGVSAARVRDALAEQRLAPQHRNGGGGRR